jgi:hypothetical protein
VERAAERAAEKAAEKVAKRAAERAVEKERGRRRLQTGRMASQTTERRARDGSYTCSRDHQ